MKSCNQIATSLLFFVFIANLEQSGGRIPDAWCVKPTFSLKVTINHTKIESRAIKIPTEVSRCCFK